VDFYLFFATSFLAPATAASSDCPQLCPQKAQNFFSWASSDGYRIILLEVMSFFFIFCIIDGLLSTFVLLFQNLLLSVLFFSIQGIHPVSVIVGAALTQVRIVCSPHRFPNIFQFNNLTV